MANFEIYEDESGDHRWRLRAGEHVVAAGGQGHWDPDEAAEALEQVREAAPQGEIVESGSPRFDVYQALSGDWRWRMVGPGGRVVADSGEAYATKAAARDAILAVQAVVEDADLLG